MEKIKKIRRISNQKTEKLGEYFQSSLSTIFKKNREKYLTAYVEVHWKEAVGENIGKNARFVGIENKELLLSVKHPAWANELKCLEEEMVSKVNAFVGKNMVKKLRFVPSRLKKEEKKEETIQTKDTLQSEIIFDNLTNTEKSDIEKTLSEVSDEDLKKALEKYKGVSKRFLNYKQKNMTKCKICGEYYKGKVCLKCFIRRQKELKTKLVKLLKDAPFLSYAEAVKEIPTITGDFFNKIRMEMVQRLAQKVDSKDYKSVDAMNLTMLYMTVKPKYVTEELVKKTLKRLRYDLALSRVFEKKVEKKPKKVTKKIDKGKKK